MIQGNVSLYRNGTVREPVVMLLLLLLQIFFKSVLLKSDTVLWLTMLIFLLCFEFKKGQQQIVKGEHCVYNLVWKRGKK